MAAAKREKQAETRQFPIWRFLFARQCLLDALESMNRLVNKNDIEDLDLV